MYAEPRLRSYEERVARRNQELQALKDAYAGLSIRSTRIHDT